MSGGYIARSLTKHTKRVADLLQQFMAKGLVQKDGDTAVIKTVIVPPDRPKE